MIKFVASILLSAALMAAEIPGTADTAKTRAWLSMTEAQRLEADIEYKAAACGLSVETFDLLSRTIEAESDRSDNLEGRVLIALTILNRVDSTSFPGTIEGVITQEGQFEVYYNGSIYGISRTALSDMAIIEAQRRIAEGIAPRVMYFNNSNYAYGEPYCYEGGNYFVTTND